MLGQIVIENGQKKIVPLTADAGAGNPVGTIIPMYKKSNPNGYLYCDGSTFDETKYPLLYAYLGSNVLPDYRECAIVGAEQNTTNTIGNHDVFTQGEFKDDQIQSHAHRVYVNGDNNFPFDVTLGEGYGGTSGWAGGTQFPTVALGNYGNTSRMGNTTRGKRKAVYFYIKATSGLSENAQDNVINTLNEQRSYSETEHLTGKKWIDGKPIYAKTVDCGALPNATTKTTAHNITNLDIVVSIRGVATNTSRTAYLLLPYVASNDALYNTTVDVNQTNISYSCQKNLSSYNVSYVTLEYTKTTV